MASLKSFLSRDLTHRTTIWGFLDIASFGLATGHTSLMVHYYALLSYFSPCGSTPVLKSHMSLYIVSALFWLFQNSIVSRTSTTNVAPANVAIEYNKEPITLNGTFDFPSEFRGHPTPEIDAAWMAVSMGGKKFTLLQLLLVALNFFFWHTSQAYSLDSWTVFKSGMERCAVKSQVSRGRWRGLHCIDRSYSSATLFGESNNNFENWSFVSCLV